MTAVADQPQPKHTGYNAVPGRIAGMYLAGATSRIVTFTTRTLNPGGGVHTASDAFAILDRATVGEDRVRMWLISKFGVPKWVDPFDVGEVYENPAHAVRSLILDGNSCEWEPCDGTATGIFYAEGEGSLFCPAHLDLVEVPDDNALAGTPFVRITVSPLGEIAAVAGEVGA